MPDPKETELQIDDGAQITRVDIQCTSCEGEPYLDWGERATLTLQAGEQLEYTFTCPKCKHTVRMRGRVGSA